MLHSRSARRWQATAVWPVQDPRLLKLMLRATGALIWQTDHLQLLEGRGVWSIYDFSNHFEQTSGRVADLGSTLSSTTSPAAERTLSNSTQLKASIRVELPLTTLTPAELNQQVAAANSFARKRRPRASRATSRRSAAWHPGAANEAHQRRQTTTAQHRHTSGV